MKGFQSLAILLVISSLLLLLDHTDAANIKALNAEVEKRSIDIPNESSNGDHGHHVVKRADIFAGFRDLMDIFNSFIGAFKNIYPQIRKALLDFGVNVPLPPFFDQKNK